MPRQIPLYTGTLPSFYKSGVHEFRDEEKNQFRAPVACDLWKTGKAHPIPSVAQMKVLLGQVSKGYFDEGMLVLMCNGTKYAYTKCVY